MIWKDLFSFNSRQRNGIIVLLSLLLLLISWLIVSNYLPPSPGKVDFSRFKAEVANLRRHTPDKSEEEDSALLLPNQAIAETNEHEKINLNNCSVKQLTHCPGIGYYLALAIVNYRDLHGQFKNSDDLRQIKAIDDSTLAKIKKYAAISPADAPK